jgi:hypothetical protein
MCGYAHVRNGSFASILRRPPMSDYIFGHFVPSPAIRAGTLSYRRNITRPGMTRFR